MTILVVCALAIEGRLLSELESVPGVEVHVTGIGPGRATAWASRAIVSGHRAVIAAGFCGALDPMLPRGVLVAAETVVDGPGGTVFRADPQLLATTYPIRRGALVSMPRLVRTPGERSVIPGTIVDMESAALARVAARRRVPFLSIGVVTDRATDTLPDLERVVDAFGRPRLLRTVGPASA